MAYPIINPLLNFNSKNKWDVVRLTFYSLIMDLFITNLFFWDNVFTDSGIVKMEKEITGYFTYDNKT